MYQEEEKEIQEKVVEIKRISKKTKGGNAIRFSALVVVGDKKGHVGVGLAKATSVSAAIQKAVTAAKKRMVSVPLKGRTIPFEVSTKFSAAKILLKPAPPGSGIIAGGALRVVLDLAGIQDASGKILGSNNKTANVYATLKALKTLSQLVNLKKTKNL